LTIFEDIIHKPFQEFKDLFNKGSFDELPDWKQWDNTIELILDAQTFSTKVYPLTPVKQRQLDKFLTDNLKSRCICPSKSPMASPVFFIKKKDRSLHLIQNYQKLNSMTIEDHLPPPVDPRYPQ